jgi:hypothetical protein
MDGFLLLEGITHLVKSVLRRCLAPLASRLCWSQSAFYRIGMSLSANLSGCEP